MGTGKFNTGAVTLRWTSIPSRGECKYSQSLYATETRIRSGLVGHLVHMQTSHFTLTCKRLRYNLEENGIKFVLKAEQKKAIELFF